MAAIRTALTRVAAGRLRYSATSERLWLTAHGVACARAPASIARVTASPDLAWRACATASRSVHTACVAPRAGVDGSITDIPPRDSSFSVVSGDDMAAFRSMLGAGAAGRVVTDPDQLSAFNIDWMQKWGGNAPAALRPKTTEELAQILAYCNDRSIAVVPQGGNTGLVGGSVPVHDEIVISTALMNNVISFDEGSGVLVCEAGCVLEQLDTWLRERDHIMPLDLGAKGSCHIGGNASTNAGGLRYIRYGSLHGSILGLEVVLADGTVLDMLNTLRKDNVGPDLKQLFIGSEGTLGVITKLAIQVPRKPASVQVAFFGCSDFENVQQTLMRAKQLLGEVLSAVEFADENALGFSLGHLKEEHPLGEAAPFNMVIETSGSNAEHDQAKLFHFLEVVMEEGLVLDGVVAQDDTQASRLWSLREQIAVGLGAAGTVYKYDLSIPLASMYELVEVTREKLAREVDGDVKPVVVGYGHVGDCNLHLNVSTPRGSPSILHHLEPFLVEWTAQRNGSISAEHGVGQCKREFMGLQRSPAVLAQLSQLKRMFDPKGILNPYKGVKVEP